jgi:hypothetical protein
MTLLGFQSKKSRKYMMKNTSASVASAPTSQSLAARRYRRIGTTANVMIPTAANQVMANFFGSLKSPVGTPYEPFNHAQSVDGETRSESRV